MLTINLSRYCTIGNKQDKLLPFVVIVIFFLYGAMPLTNSCKSLYLAGIERIRNKINYTDIVFNMMPKYFTLSELQDVYETILGKKLLAPAFRRIIANKVEKTDKMQTGKGHRPSALFKYKER